MSQERKMGRNYPCPCGSGRKYKRCCVGRVAWESLARAPIAEKVRHLSLRGKNLLFLERIGEALKLDEIKPKADFANLKRAFTPEAVRHIYEAIPTIWPDYSDYTRCLSKENDQVTGLYTGTYEPEAIFRALTLHSIYSDRILLVDPFMYPSRARDEYNPLLHPEEHRANVVKWSFLWLSLAPWLDTGIVNFVRKPGDFDPAVDREVMEVQRRRFEESPELQQIAEQQSEDTVKNMGPLLKDMMEYYVICHSDEWLLDMYRRLPQDRPWNTEKEFLQFIKQWRDAHPYYVDRLAGQRGELLYVSTGACYEMAKRICAISNSHLITDLPVRWKEIELDHKHAKIDSHGWTPFAKAIQNANLKVLNNIPLQAAFQLRREQRLEAMRHFFNRVWRACREPDIFSEANANNLAAELVERIREAESEWQKIDEQLLKWLGLTGGALISSGIAGFVNAGTAAVVTGGVGLALSQLQRKSFKKRFPAAFFLGIRK